ncbi:MAG: YkgJ family cysteine cluster protein [Alphaproteobacteria bacterium]
MPCDGCTLCCKNDQIILRPEDGDDLDFYDWEPIASALYPGQSSPALKRDPATGNCVYLRDSGCSIHERAPAICRRFHCARTYKALAQLSDEARKRLWRRGDVLETALVERGRNRLRLARKMGLDGIIDTDRQVAAFEELAAEPVADRRKRR